MMPNKTRRTFMLASGTWTAIAVFGAVRPLAAAAAEVFEVTRTEAEWKKLLSPNQYAVLREESTERPYSSPLNDEHRDGKFACVGCGLELFSSKTKFDSKTGWPSFWQPLDRAVGQRKDFTLGMARTEVHCRRCGGHLGHVFEDGPKPTGLRYCMNGVAMRFIAGPA
jgi:peptide-methionine (R)-S-oxide reductase